MFSRHGKDPLWQMEYEHFERCLRLLTPQPSDTDMRDEIENQRLAEIDIANYKQEDQ